MTKLFSLRANAIDAPSDRLTSRIEEEVFELWSANIVENPINEKNIESDESDGVNF
jgi:hypothetical protein